MKHESAMLTEYMTNGRQSKGKMAMRMEWNQRYLISISHFREISFKVVI